jgi:PiT family inorganic phosphate transporter
MASLDGRVVRDIVTSWVVTLPAAAGMSMIFFFILKAVRGNVAAS